jgi:peptidoglycan/LPS O-acetylase OafA/YrhL
MKASFSTLDLPTAPWSGATAVARARRPEAASRYRPDIDGLRAVAVISVVLFHAGLFPFRSGFVGVDIFFVISGYLIGGIVLRDVKERRFQFARFYARRARRILPALFVVVLAACVVGWFVLSASEFRGVGASATSTLLAVSNFSFWRFQDYFFPDSRLSPLLMTWSLGVEEQFYVFFPFLIIAAARLGPGRIPIVIGAISLASFVFSVWCTKAYPAAAFYLLPPRAWELGVGAMLAAFEISPDAWRTPLIAWVRSKSAQQGLAWIGVALLSTAVFGFDESTPFPGLMALLPVFGAAALISAESSFVNRRLLSSRPMVFVGLVSYSWYLWHWPLMSYFRIIVPNTPPIWAMVVIAAVAFGLAVLSWRYVELPFRRPRLDPLPVLRRYGWALAAALALPLAIKLSDGAPQRLPTQAREAEAIVAAGRGGACLVVWDQSRPNLSRDCVLQVPGRPTVALIGDSHAGALAQGLRELAAQENVGFEILAKTSCPPLLDVTVWTKEQPALTEACATFVDDAVRRVAANPDVRLVLLAGLWSGPLAAGSVQERYLDHRQPSASEDGLDLLRIGLERTIGALTAAGKQVILVGDTPYWRFDPSRLILAKSIPLREKLFNIFCVDCANGFPESAGRQLVETPYKPSDDIIRELGSSPGRVGFIDLFSRFCSDGRCAYQQAGEPLFVDRQHLSVVGARFALQGTDLVPDK